MLHLKEHRAMTRRIKLTIRDTLAFYRESLGDYTFNPEVSQTQSYWFALPDAALDDKDNVVPQFREPILQAIYGKAWRRGNADGSKYIVLHIEPAIPTPQEEKERPWKSERITCIAIGEGGESEAVEPDRF
jgi:hypothetical protein